MSAKPAPKKNNGNPAKLHHGRSSMTRAATRFSLLELDGFCLAYRAERSIAKACKALGISESKGNQLVKHPRFNERVELIREKFVDKIIDKAADKFVLNLSEIDRKVYDVLANGETHPYRGDSDKVAAGIALYKRLKLIDGARVIQNNSNSAAAAAQLSGSTSFQVYESAWLTQKHATWDQQLEEKHGKLIEATAE